MRRLIAFSLAFVLLTFTSLLLSQAQAQAQAKRHAPALHSTTTRSSLAQSLEAAAVTDRRATHPAAVSHLSRELFIGADNSRHTRRSRAFPDNKPRLAPRPELRC